MACQYKSRGADNPVNTRVLQYIEDTSERSADDILNILEELQVIERAFEGDILINPDTSNDTTLKDLNEAAQTFFAVTGNLIDTIVVSGVTYVQVNSTVLSRMSPISKEEYEAIQGEQAKLEEPGPAPDDTQETLDPEQDYEETSFESTVNEVFQKKQKKDLVTQKIIVNLELQIDRLERASQESPLSNKRLNELRALQQQLRKVKAGSEKLDDYYNFIVYMTNLADRSKNLLANIESKYARNYKTMSQKERGETLKKISDLKETIDAFYNDSADLSISNMLLQKIQTLPGEQLQKDDMIVKLADAIVSMADTNRKYLDVAIPIQADYLMSFAPIEVNEQLDERIKYIRTTNNLSGLNTSDPRLSKIRKDKLLTNEQKRQATLELNVLQLTEKKIGREAIINELRETHKDASSFSTYADPLIYSSEPAIQMFALAVKEKMIEANDNTLDTVYSLKEAYRRFRDSKGISEGDPAELYDDIIEEVTLFVRGEDGTLSPKKVMSFVQPVNVTKFYAEQNRAFEEFKIKFNFPKEVADYNDYFSGKNPDGNNYMKATSQWYKDNTDPIEGADEYILNLERGIDSLLKQLRAASEEGNRDKFLSIQLELNGLQYELKKVSRNGVPIGKLTTPKMSLYANPKFDSMSQTSKEYYSLLLDVYTKDQAKVGKNSMRKNSWDSYSYLLPGIRTSTIDALKDQKNIDPITKMLSDSFTYQETDTEFGEAIKANGEKLKVIPRYYTNLLDSNIVSKNVTSSLLMFNGMANRYAAKSDIVGVVNVMHSAVGERDILQMTSNGGPLLTKIATRFGYQIVPPIKGRETNTFRQLESFIDSFYYGVEENEKSIQILDRELNLNKTASQLSTGVAASTLSFNFLQATNQLIMDSVTNTQEAVANQFYGNEELMWARSKLHFGGHSLTAMKDGLNPKIVMQTKIGKMLEMFDGMQDFEEGLSEKTTTVGRKLAQTRTLFMLQKGVEFLTTAERLLAFSRTYKGKLKDAQGKVILNEAGEEADLWDVLIEDSRGKLIIDPKVKNFNKAQFTMKFHGLSRRANQLKGKFDKTLLERYWWGKLIALFRRYYVPGWRKRFGHSEGGVHLDMELGQVTEGYYGAMWDIFQDMLFYVRSGDYGKAIDALVKTEGNAQKAQSVRRFLFEAGSVVLLTAIIAIIQGLSDDDEEDNKLLSHIAYQSLRLRSELTAYINPVETFRIIENPTAAANLVRNIWGLGKSTMEYAGNKVGIVPDDQIYYQRRAGSWEKGDLKWTKEFLDVVPIFSGVIKSKDPEEALKYYMLTE